MLCSHCRRRHGCCRPNPEFPFDHVVLLVDASNAERAVTASSPPSLLENVVVVDFADPCLAESLSQLLPSLARRRTEDRTRLQTQLP